VALTQASLSSKLKSEIENLYGAADDNSLLVKFCDAIAKAVVDEIQANAVVTVNGVQGGAASASGTVA
jgi:hypothetical protein